MPLPNLKALTISHTKGSYEKEDETEYDGGEYDKYKVQSTFACVQMLRLAPSLVECTLEGIHFDDYDRYAVDGAAPLVLPVPRVLYLSRNDSSGAPILQCLTLPALERLVISDLNIDAEDALAFFRRSSAPSNRIPFSPP
jgi:hypothetical protein